ncbi:universal stress protein [Zestomonas carbonaria]|uniref:Universal stress protein E n=1 Tax=Zestomonas carbonaria TaxID=2762745 RepID=A0A7U7ESX9_9GAMM|nr:universal stress protein [Pseudomonas carbonaria]CAD5110446.1 Universal stress protein E [Pseudomonas carbonaria]
MRQYRRLLLIANPAMPNSSALQRAAAIAKACGASLHIVALGGPFENLWSLDQHVLEQARNDFLTQQPARLNEVVERLRGEGIQATSEAVWTDDPLEEILLHVREMPADLVIKDTQPEPALKRAFITPLDWRLLRECPVPLHMVSFAEHPLPRKVVAAVDITEGEDMIAGVNESILAAAYALALQCDAELHVLSAYENTPLNMAYATSPASWTAEIHEALAKLLRNSFNRFADQHGVPENRRHIVMGPPIKVISDFVMENRMDVVVMGTLNRQGLEKILGSTSELTLYRIPASILAVRPGQE